MDARGSCRLPLWVGMCDVNSTCVINKRLSRMGPSILTHQPPSIKVGQTIKITSFRGFTSRSLPDNLACFTSHPERFLRFYRIYIHSSFVLLFRCVFVAFARLACSHASVRFPSCLGSFLGIGNGSFFSIDGHGCTTCASSARRTRRVARQRGVRGGCDGELQVVRHVPRSTHVLDARNRSARDAEGGRNKNAKQPRRRSANEELACVRGIVAPIELARLRCRRKVDVATGRVQVRASASRQETVLPWT